MKLLDLFLKKYFTTFLQETIGDFNADFYHINGLTLEQKKRREHLSEEDLQKNKAIMDSLTKGGCSINIDCNGEVCSLNFFYTLCDD